MNRRMVYFTVGQLILILAGLMLLPLAVSFVYGEKCYLSFLITIGICVVSGSLLLTVFKPRNKVIYAKEGFVIVALSWIAVSALGALPFVISGEVPSYADAFFETVSGFTTTGASILTDVEALSHGLLFWRSFTHWVGGMGVLVFIMAIVPISDRSIHIMRAEMPGPIVGKLVPKVRDTAKILYLIYVVLTMVEVVFLLFGGMSVFDAFVHTFGTAGTGGFGVKANSLAGYSPYLQWVITVFMLIFGVNFNLYYLLLIKRFKSVFKSEELWTYICVVLVSVGIIAYNISGMYGTLEETLRQSVFQVSSIITTTGYSSCDFNMWPTLSKAILLLLMFIGGCAGSTAGGLKVSRVMLLFKMIRNEIKHLLHPRSVNVVKLEGKKVENATLHSVSNYFALYMFLFVAVFFIVSLEGSFDLETNITATASCFNNVGPGFAGVGPLSSYAAYSDLSKYVLSAAMLLGRLEIFPLIVLFNPSTWIKR